MFFKSAEYQKIQSDNSQAFNICRSGSVKELQCLLDAGHPVDMSLDSESLLAAAVKANHHEIVDLLIERGADVNRRKHHFEPVLARAVKNRDMRMVKKLIAAGADVNATEKVSWHSVLHLAARPGGKEICVELIKNGADWLAQKPRETVTLPRLIEIDDGSIFDAISNQKNFLTKTCAYGLTVTHWMSHLGHLGNLKHAIESGALIDAQDSTWKHTALHWALHADRADCVEYLLSVGANVSLTNRSGVTPVQLGVNMKKATAVVKYLTARGYSPLDVFNDPAGEELIGKPLESLFENFPIALNNLEVLRQEYRSMKASETIMDVFSNAIEPADAAAHHPSIRHRPNSMKL